MSCDRCKHTSLDRDGGAAGSTSARVRVHTVRCAARHGAAGPRCVRAPPLRADTWIVLAALAVCLGACHVDPGYQGRSSRDWIRMLEHPEPRTRVDAATALGHVLRLQPESPAVVDALIQALADSSDHVRLAAGFALATDGVRAPDAVPGLVDVLRDTAHADTRLHAAQILGRFGSAARAAVPALSTALVDSDAGVRGAAGAALGQIGPPASVATPALVRLAADSRPALRRTALDALVRVAAPAPASVPVFVRVLASDSAAEVRVAAADAMAALGPAAVSGAPAATRALTDEDARVRAAAATALASIGPGARAAVPALQVATRDPDRTVADAAVDALASVQGRPRRPPRPIHEP